MDIRTYLKERVLLLDGAMGTYYASFPQTKEISCETANLLRPELIRHIHTEYLNAGSRGIITNTFGVNRPAFLGNDQQAEAVLEAGWKLANEAVDGFRTETQNEAEDVFVFADIGPISDQEVSAASEYIWIAERFLRLGAENFIFETNSSPEGIADACAYIREKRPEAFITVSFAAQPDGYTASGYDVHQLLTRFNSLENVDLVGLNCMSSARHMLELVRRLRTEGMRLCLKPNAGYPVVLGTRTVYDSNPDYFAAVAACMPSEGAVMLGGCCGTTPDFIRRLRDNLKGNSISKILPENVPASRAVFPASHGTEPENTFITKLKSKEKPFAVELDPPENFDFSAFMSNTWLLKRKGADMITIADCPIARSRMDSTLLACKLRRELGIEVMPHMTSRDRNLNATKGLLMGGYAEGIRNILLVTGDPIPTAQRDEVKSVFQFNSRKMAAYVHSLNGRMIPGSFNIFGALNVNARNFRIQLELAKEKQSCGMIGFLTQPVLTKQGMENLMLARRELDAFILGGIMPVVSAANARYMDSEINGINVDREIIERFEGLDRAAAEELSVRISTEIALKMSEYVDGYYIITPFNRAALVGRIIDSVRERLSEG
ncbi:MAG: bifunctional homocysteine S-methyltransferase/methylenetetrahydrofolate reductase [Clostridiales bacterium]|nr:bifunctional homocysteine S-methyltransferase/methylenetetrahydrofolate reductase [Clostridiales bacterium]